MFFYAQSKSLFKRSLVVEPAFNLLHLVVSSYRLYINDLKIIKGNVSHFGEKMMCQFLV